MNVQNVIDNLCISTLEYRDENNHDVSKYINDRKSELIKVHPYINHLYLIILDFRKLIFTSLSKH